MIQNAYDPSPDFGRVSNSQNAAIMGMPNQDTPMMVCHYLKPIYHRSRLIKIQNGPNLLPDNIDAAVGAQNVSYMGNTGSQTPIIVRHRPVTYRLTTRYLS